jgi:hypothetical protein
MDRIDRTLSDELNLNLNSLIDTNANIDYDMLSSKYGLTKHNLMTRVYNLKVKRKLNYIKNPNSSECKDINNEGRAFTENEIDALAAKTAQNIRLGLTKTDEGMKTLKQLESMKISFKDKHDYEQKILVCPYQETHKPEDKMCDKCPAEVVTTPIQAT